MPRAIWLRVAIILDYRFVLAIDLMMALAMFRVFLNK
jgi:hypothetical protein